jgi:hypothetical protein
MHILIIDGQGGKIGRAVAEAVLKELPEAQLSVVGTNALATSNMLRSGVKDAATGENPVVVMAPKADYIIGPIGIVIADALMGEITPKMARAVGQSAARKILIPVNRCDNLVVGVEDIPLAEMIRRTIALLR